MCNVKLDVCVKVFPHVGHITSWLSLCSFISFSVPNFCLQYVQGITLECTAVLWSSKSFLVLNVRGNLTHLKKVLVLHLHLQNKAAKRHIMFSNFGRHVLRKIYYNLKLWRCLYLACYIICYITTRRLEGRTVTKLSLTAFQIVSLIASSIAPSVASLIACLIVYLMASFIASLTASLTASLITLEIAWPSRFYVKFVLNMF